MKKLIFRLLVISFIFSSSLTYAQFDSIVKAQFVREKIIPSKKINAQDLVFKRFESNGNIIFDQFFRSKSNLPIRSVKAILEDSRGYIWIGGPGGLARYDGKEFQEIGQHGQLINPNVSCIAEDVQGNIWIGTQDGISIYNGQRFLDCYSDFRLTQAYSIIIDSLGSMWIGSREGISVSNDMTSLNNKIGIDSRLRDSLIFYLSVENMDNLLVGTREGIYKYDTQSGRYAKSFLNAEIDSSQVMDIEIDKKK